MKLEAQKRDINQNLDTLRVDAKLPAVCYGPDVESTSIVLDYKTFMMLTREAGSSTIIDLSIDGEEHEVLIKQIDRDPLSDAMIHVDFYAIKRGAEIEIAVPVHFIGESPAAKADAVINEIIHEINVRCRPRVLPSHIDIDLALLTEIGSTITVGDLQLAEGITILNAPEDAIAAVNAAVEEVEEVDDAAELADVLADKTEDGEEGGEGEEATEK